MWEGDGGDLADLPLGLQVGDGGELDRLVWEGDGGTLAVLPLGLQECGGGEPDRFCLFFEEEVW